MIIRMAASTHIFHFLIIVIPYYIYNITLTTLFDIVEKGLGGKVKIDVLVDTPPYEFESMMASEPKEEPMP